MNKIRKVYLYLFFVISVFVMPIGYGRAEEGKTINLDSLIEEGLKNNPGIEALYNNWVAAGYKVKQAESLPDPRLTFSYFGENVETRVGPQERKYGASQKIPFPGKLGLKG